MKKLIISMLVVVMALAGCLTILAACNGGGSSDYDHTIIFYSSQGTSYVPITAKAIAEFEKKYPGWTVTHSTQGGYDDVLNKVRSDLQAGLQPDLAYCYADHVALYNRSKAVVHLDNLIASDIAVTTADDETGILGLTKEQEDDFIEGYYAEGAAFGDDHMYMLPFSKSTELMYYNKDFFTANNIELPDHWFASDGKQGQQPRRTTRRVFHP